MEQATRWSRHATRLAGGSIAVLGLAVIAAWHTHAVVILQPRPGLIAPVYNTALSFLACGLGLLAIAGGRPGAALPCGALAGLLGLLNVAQYVFGVDLGIDQLVIEHFITTKTPHPGRMAPNSAACFVLAAVALMLEGTRGLAGRRPPIVGVIGSVVVAFGTVALSGYFLGIKTYGWGSFLPMAVQTAAGCAMLGVGLMAAAWDEGQGDRGTAPRWLPIPVGLAGLTATVCLWQPLVAQGHAQIERTVEAELDAARGALAAGLEARAFALLALARRDDPARAAFERDARLVLGHFADLRALERVDPSGSTRQVVTTEGAAEDDLSTDPLQPRSRVLREARERREARFLVAAKGQPGGPILLAAAPGEGEGAGSILGVIRLVEVCAGSLPPGVAPSAALVVADADGVLYDRDAGDRRLADEWDRDGSVESHGLSWRVRAWPKAEALARWRSSVPEAVMTVGGLFSVVLAVAVRLAQVSRRRSLEVESANRRLGSEVADRVQAEHSLRATTDDLNRTLDEIRGAVAVLASTSSELLASMSQQAVGLQEQVAAVAETVTTIEEVARTSEQASRQARAVDDTIQRTLKIGQSGRQAVEDSSRALGDVKDQVESTADTILKLAEKAQAIGEIIATVNEIAEQTNVLALNASIEASRAGAQGAGFAVVAREVKVLADQSKKATVQVSRILGDIQQATHTSALAAEQVGKGVADAVRMNGHAGEAIGTLAEALAEAAQAVTQVVAASTQEALGMVQVSEAMRSIEQVERKNDTALRQLERAAQDLKALSTRLSVLATA